MTSMPQPLRREVVTEPAVAVLTPEAARTPVALVVRTLAIPTRAILTRAARVPAPKAVVVRWASSFKAPLQGDRFAPVITQGDALG